MIEKSFKIETYYPMNSDPTEFNYQHFLEILSKTL